MPKFTNKLVDESSPYLLILAHNKAFLAQKYNIQTTTTFSSGMEKMDTYSSLENFINETKNNDKNILPFIILVDKMISNFSSSLNPNRWYRC